MSIRCPPEMVDHIIDSLQGNPETLKQCCLVSKSWVSRSRKHLFGTVMFVGPDDIAAWKRTFTDTSNSPARHTHTLTIHCPGAFTSADAVESGWISTFSRLDRLVLNNHDKFPNDSEISLVALQNLPPTLKSLSLFSFWISCPHAFAFIRSFPFLEDLTLSGGFANESKETQIAISSSTSTSPPLTGTLHLGLSGIMSATRELLSLPSGLHLKGLRLHWNMEEDVSATAELVAACLDTLEHLEIVVYDLEGTFSRFRLGHPLTRIPTHRYIYAPFDRPLESDKT